MARLVASLCLLAGAGFLAGGEAQACGDKLLVRGRHPRSQRVHGAVQRASILILVDERGQLREALHEMKLERDLELAGHRLRFVSTSDDLAELVRAGRYDIVLTGLAEAAALRSELPKAPRGPTLLPVVVNATGEEWAQAQAEFSCIRGSTSAEDHYLAVVEKVMQQRRAQMRAERK